MKIAVLDLTSRRILRLIFLGLICENTDYFLLEEWPWIHALGSPLKKLEINLIKIDLYHILDPLPQGRIQTFFGVEDKKLLKTSKICLHYIFVTFL